jgi:two-component system, NarL family, response regulator DegU
MTKKTTIAIVDDHAMFREGLAGLLKDFDELRVIIQASSGIDLMAQLKFQQPDIVLLDIQMPLMDGIETTISIKKKYPDIKIIILTMHNDEELIFDLIKKGANGFLPKDKSVEHVVDAIYAVLEKNYYYNDYMSQAMISGINSETNKRQVYVKNPLSERELEIIRLICKQYNTKEIADIVKLSLRTVQKHKENIYSKTKSKNSNGLIMYAMKHKLLN